MADTLTDTLTDIMLWNEEMPLSECRLTIEVEQMRAQAVSMSLRVRYSEELARKLQQAKARHERIPVALKVAGTPYRGTALLDNRHFWHIADEQLDFTLCALEMLPDEARMPWTPTKS